MNRYSKAVIYELYVDGVELVYVGSTTQTLKQRLAEHKSRSKIATKFTYTSKPLFELGEVQIRELESVSYDSIEDLNIREGFWIKQKICLNRKIAGQPFG